MITPQPHETPTKNIVENKSVSPGKDNKNLSDGVVDHKQLMFETFFLTHQAVKLDKMNIYLNEARLLYQECSSIFNLLSPYLPGEIGEVINKMSKTYYFRGRNIAKSSYHRKFKPHPTLKKKYQKWKKRLPENELTIEKQKAKRPLWLMRNLKRTIRCHGGSYVLPDFYIPKQVWTMRGYQLRYLKEKIELFEKITDGMRSAVVSKNRQKGIIDLKANIKKYTEKFFQATDSKEEKSLKKQVQVAEKLEKKIKKKRRRGSVLRNLEPNFNEEYVQALVTFIDSTEFLENWVDEAVRTNNRIQLSALEDIGKNIYFSILLKIVFKDVQNLLKVFFRRCRQAFTSLEFC